MDLTRLEINRRTALLTSAAIAANVINPMRAFAQETPRKGGVFNTVPADHDVTDELAAYKLAGEPFPGSFGIFYKVNKPTKNAKEAEINKSFQGKLSGLKDWQILQKNFDRMK